MGQLLWRDSQRSMHLAWKKWSHGSVRSKSPSSHSPRQTVHSVSRAASVQVSPSVAAAVNPLQTQHIDFRCRSTLRPTSWCTFAHLIRYFIQSQTICSPKQDQRVLQEPHC